MRVSYDHEPSTLEAVGDGSFRYRFNIEEQTSEIHAEGTDEPVSTRTSWKCDEVIGRATLPLPPLVPNGSATK